MSVRKERAVNKWKRYSILQGHVMILEFLQAESKSVIFFVRNCRYFSGMK